MSQVLLGSVLLLSCWTPRADAYRFFAIESVTTVFPTVNPPTVWNPEIWAPGETLSFSLVDLPEWDALSADIEEVRHQIEAALRAWARIPSADIRWRIGEVVSLENADREDPSKHYLGTQQGRISTTYMRFNRRSDGVWYATQAEVRMGDGHIAEPNIFRYAVLHELGHVAGLDHASVYSRGERPGNVADGLLTRSWRFDPVMSYGYAGLDRYRDYDSMLTADDRVGVSLLRPKSGWEESTGNIRGTVLVAGRDPAALVHVLATRVREDGTMGGSVGAFTNLFGEFVVGGLEPGEYALLVRALVIRRAHPDLLPWVNTGVRDTIWGAPVTVRPGRRAGPVTIVVRSGAERAKL